MTEEKEAMFRGRSALVVLVLAAILVLSQAASISTANAQQPDQLIDHIVIIMQENHSFDNYFGKYPGVNGIPQNAQMPVNPQNPSLGFVKPFLTTDVALPDMPHGYVASVKAYDNGSMDGFMVAENQNRDTMSHYDNRTLPYYWDMAKHYVLADNFFSSVLSYSLPNHWYSIAGQAPNASIYHGFGRQTTEELKNEYLEESNVIETIADLLMNSSVSWRYYDFPLKTGGYNASIDSGQAFSYWNPFAAKNTSYAQGYAEHFVDRAQIFSDLRSRALPEVSWVIPSGVLSEHPPANVTLGMIWVTYVVDSIMRSRYWDSTAIIITWDDYGGFYDHVPPPRIDELGLSFRVPTLIISPFSKNSYIDHTMYSFESIMKFIEWRFNLPSLTKRDAEASNLLSAFDFNQPASPIPHIIPLSEAELMAIEPFISSVPLVITFESFLIGISILLVVAGIALIGFSVATRWRKPMRKTVGR